VYRVGCPNTLMNTNYEARGQRLHLVGSCGGEHQPFREMEATGVGGDCPYFVRDQSLGLAIKERVEGEEGRSAERNEMERT